MDEHLPKNLVEDAAEEGETLTVRARNGGAEVRYPNGDREFYYRGWEVHTWGKPGAWDRYRCGKYHYATLAEVKKHVDQTIAAKAQAANT